MGKIESTHPDYDKVQEKWVVVDDAESANYEEYVIPPIYTQGRSANARVTARNMNYIKRAIYSNFTKITLDVLVGTVTYKEPTIELPTSLEYLLDDCTHDRLSMSQLTRKGLREQAKKGRIVLLTDFPPIPEGLTQQQITALNPKPRIRAYDAKDFINWDERDYPDGRKLCFAVLRELVSVRVDGYKWKSEYQYRELTLEDDGKGLIRYAVMIKDKNDKPLLKEPFYPKMNGKFLDYIPLNIAGSEDNSPTVDEPPAYPIAHVNFGHLRNSAAYEDNLDKYAQGTLFVTSDMSSSQWKEMTATRPMMMGSSEAHYIGKPGSKAELLQLQPGQEVNTAMERKEQQLLAMGAFMFQNASANTPVETTQMYMGSKNAPIVNWVRNWEQALYAQIVNCARFLGTDESSIKVVFPVDFVPKNADPAIMQSLLAQHMAGIISKRVIREYNRNVDVLSEDITDEELDAEIAIESPPVDAFGNNQDDNDE